MERARFGEAERLRNLADGVLCAGQLTDRQIATQRVLDRTDRLTLFIEPAPYRRHADAKIGGELVESRPAVGRHGATPAKNACGDDTLVRIGRAQCGGRGCQDGESTVDAETFKQQK